MASPAGTWVAFKEMGRWGRPRFLSVDLDTLLKLRGVVAGAYRETMLAKRPEDRLGFVPRTFAIWAIERAGLSRPKWVADDDVAMDFAFYQALKVYAGSWECGASGKGKRLLSAYAEEAS